MSECLRSVKTIDSHLQFHKMYFPVYKHLPKWLCVLTIQLLQYLDIVIFSDLLLIIEVLVNQ